MDALGATPRSGGGWGKVVAAAAAAARAAAGDAELSGVVAAVGVGADWGIVLDTLSTHRVSTGCRPTGGRHPVDHGGGGSAAAPAAGVLALALAAAPAEERVAWLALAAFAPGAWVCRIFRHLENTSEDALCP